MSAAYTAAQTKDQWWGRAPGLDLLNAGGIYFIYIYI